MAEKGVITQFQFYGYESDKNVPLAQDKWMGTSIGDNSKPVNLLENYGSAIKIGIQTLPGVKFYLNNTQPGIIINHTGVYELDLTDITTTVNSLYFDPESLARISEIDGANLIVDVMYKSEKGAIN